MSSFLTLFLLISKKKFGNDTYKCFDCST